MPWRSAYELARSAFLLITASMVEPSTRWKAGPLFFSVASPHPITPQRIISLSTICFWIIFSTTRVFMYSLHSSIPALLNQSQKFHDKPSLNKRGLMG